MEYKFKGSLRPGIQTSPWIILGSTAILLIVVMVLAFQNTNRERRYMSELLSAKGAALIRAVEAGARTGMMGMRWGGQQIQRLLEETARMPDVLYMAVIDNNSLAVAHSDPSKINQPFDQGRKVTHLGPHEIENWELVTLSDQQQIFEVHRHFRPLPFNETQPPGHMRSMMRRHMMRSGPTDDWFSPEKRKELLIIIGLDVTPFEEAIRSDIRTTVVLSVVMLLLGFGGFVSLFWMHSYRAAKRSLQDTSAFANEVVSHLPVGLIASDRSGRITFFNATAEKITGLKKTLAQNKRPDAFLPEKMCGLQESLDQGKTIIEKEMDCTFTGEDAVPVSVSATHITNDQGDFVGTVLILRDLSELRRLQHEIQRQEKLAAMGGLAAGIAHEVRNPLSSIKALATFFAEQFAEGSEAREAAGVMVLEVDRLNRVITELLEFARPAELNREAIDIGLLLSRSIRLIQQDATNKNIDVKLHTENDIDPVLIDPDRLAQCLLNLYINAIQAMEDGGTLTVKCAVDRAKNVSITVSDSGQGIAPDHLSKIFDPYYTTKKKGTGLGLAIVHKIIEAHQGHIEVNSTIGEGTSFLMMIPGRQSKQQGGNDGIA
ncbi:MAG: PAS domain-containing protein [Desulfobacterales bacterium]|nr:PAS domain-containing protein [Deltaproteobacteria bacterium]NNL41658.1 PAS domain-containing protein [Desulfobacterales bacterium]